VIFLIHFFLWRIIFEKKVFFDEFFFFQNTFCKMGKTHHEKIFNDPFVRQGFLFLSHLLSFTILNWNMKLVCKVV
jgi:hypothetical protein